MNWKIRDEKASSGRVYERVSVYDIDETHEVNLKSKSKDGKVNLAKNLDLLKV